MNKKHSKALKWIVIGMIVFGIVPVPKAAAQTALNPNPPDTPVKLIFIHHSVGENWLADGYGNLGLALEENNYFVSDTNYSWGPDSIGDSTDTLDWPRWFLGEDSERYLEALYGESRANAGGWDYYTRTLADPGGENEIIVFKSCFPNSEFGGALGEAPAPGDELTVAAAQYIYNQLLGYFASRPDKLFVVITSPPMQRIHHAENTRFFNDWLVNDWLAENNYSLHNVAVFDLYNVLTHPDNHHRYVDGQIEHSTSKGSNQLYYDSWGDDHPNESGSQKATEEFVPLLNVYYHLWQDSLETLPLAEDTDTPTSENEAQAPEEDQTPQEEAPAIQAQANNVIDDFEAGTIDGADYWVVYTDEAAPTTMTCQPTIVQAANGQRSLQIDYQVAANSWASCELLFEHPQDWDGIGFSYALRAEQAGQPYDILFYYQQGDDKGASFVQMTTPPESEGQWTTVQVPWEEFARQDSMVYPKVALGMAFIVDNTGGKTMEGTFWLDDLQVGLGSTAEDTQADSAQEPSVVESEEGNGGGFSLPVCGSIPGVLLLGFAGVFWQRRRKRT